MSNEDITELYCDFIYDKDQIYGSNPFASFGVTKDEAYSTIKQELGIDMHNVKSKKIKIQKKMSSILAQLDLQKRYAVFTILLHIANSDGFSDEENIILNDIILELEIDSKKFNDFSMDGNQACDLLQDLNQEQKNELSRYIVMVVGADGDFSNDELIWVNDAIRQLNLDMSLLIELMTKYWNK